MIFNSTEQHSKQNIATQTPPVATVILKDETGFRDEGQTIGTKVSSFLHTCFVRDIVQVMSLDLLR
jgi:hypothetical protein